MSVAFVHCPTQAETPDAVPAEVARLLAPGSEAGREAAWQAFVERYSGLLLRVAFAFAPDYDGAMDRYAYMLDELRRDDCRRMHRFSADGRGRFSTWLTTVARRLCLDHYRGRFGRGRGTGACGENVAAGRLARRRLVELAGAAVSLDGLGDALLVDPGDALGDAERREALRRALRELAPQDQLLLRLRFERDLTAGEIAPVLRLPTAFHVYRRLRRLFGTLRVQLKRRGVEA